MRSVQSSAPIGLSWVGTREETPAPRCKGQVAGLRFFSGSFLQKNGQQAERQEELALAARPERPGTPLPPSFAPFPASLAPERPQLLRGGGRDAPLRSQCFPPLVFPLSFINLVATDAA